MLFDLFPSGKKKAVTFSYDDGNVFDLEVVKVFDKYGAKCTFNLIDKWLNCDNFLTDGDVKEISKNHEIAIHTQSHPWVEQIPNDEFVKQVYECRRALENITGLPVRGMAYPNGTYSDKNLEVLKALGVCYSRATQNTKGFKHPQNFLSWQPTCHHKDAIECATNFTKLKPYTKLPILYVWGHSYEFDRENNLNILTQTLDVLAEYDDIWYATNIELYDYLTAIKNLVISEGEKSVYNPSCVTVYATENGETIEIKPGLNILQ